MIITLYSSRLRKFCCNFCCNVFSVYLGEGERYKLQNYVYFCMNLQLGGENGRFRLPCRSEYAWKLVDVEILCLTPLIRCWSCCRTAWENVRARARAQLTRAKRARLTHHDVCRNVAFICEMFNLTPRYTVGSRQKETARPLFFLDTLGKQYRP